MVKAIETVEISEQSLRTTNAPLTERPMGLVALFLCVLLGIIYFENGTLVVLLPPVFVTILFAREILDKPIVGKSISVKRTLSNSRVVEGGELVVQLIITNNSPHSTHLLEINDPILPEIQIIEGTNLFLISLNPYESTTLSYSARFHYIGFYRFDEVYIRHRDFLGLRINEFRLSESKSLSLEKYVSVVPRLEKIESLPTIKTEWMRLYGGYFQSKHVGHDTDFRGIRQYRYGDVLNRINWKASARKVQLLSNEYNWDKAIHAEIVLDTSITTSPIWNNSLRAVTSLAEFLLRMRNSVGFSTIAEFPEHLDSKIGKRQLQQIINKLIGLKPNPIRTVDILLRRLGILQKKFDPKAVIIIISPFTFSPVLDFAVSLRKHGFNILAIVLLSLEKQTEEIIYTRDYVQEFPLLHELVKTELLINRLIIRNNLKNLDIPAIEWNIQVHFGSAVQNIRRVRFKD